MHEIWCRDSDRGTSLGRSIPCPPALCSVKKIHLRPQVLRPTSPRNSSPILNRRSLQNREEDFYTSQPGFPALALGCCLRVNLLLGHRGISAELRSH
ncbi:embryonic stem cell-related gene protein-like [Pan troglodytes]|uniref:embryonic stem cell-related gene protein-like n=1 Tax=Pan troglodytes TaxID=9598 RepID=UPI003014106E